MKLFLIRTYVYTLQRFHEHKYMECFQLDSVIQWRGLILITRLVRVMTLMAVYRCSARHGGTICYKPQEKNKKTPQLSSKF